MARDGGERVGRPAPADAEVQDIDVAPAVAKPLEHQPLSRLQLSPTAVDQGLPGVFVDTLVGRRVEGDVRWGAMRVRGCWGIRARRRPPPRTHRRRRRRVPRAHPAHLARALVPDVEAESSCSAAVTAGAARRRRRWPAAPASLRRPARADGRGQPARPSRWRGAARSASSRPRAAPRTARRGSASSRRAACACLRVNLKSCASRARRTRRPRPEQAVLRPAEGEESTPASVVTRAADVQAAAALASRAPSTCRSRPRSWAQSASARTPPPSRRCPARSTARWRRPAAGTWCSSPRPDDARRAQLRRELAVRRRRRSGASRR